MLKRVNGNNIEMTPEECATRLAEEAAWANRPRPRLVEKKTEAASAPVDLAPVYDLINQVRTEISQYMAESFAAMRNDLLRYHYELQYAINAQKPDSALQTDSEATTANNIRTRDMARQRLAAIGAPRNMSWDQVAEEIVMVHNRDADTLVAP